MRWEQCEIKDFYTSDIYARYLWTKAHGGSLIMRFKTKIILMYAVFMVVIALILGLGFYKYSEGQYEKTEEKNLEVSANQLVVQMNELLNTMELTMNYILSDPGVLSSIKMLAKTPYKDVAFRYIEEAKLNISTGINTDFIIKHFYRTIFFNKTGIVISTNSTKNEIIKTKTNVDCSSMPWLTKADQEKGKPILVNNHEDTWGIKGKVQIFSLLKAVQGSNMGYIEVQRRVKDLADELQLSKDGLEFMIFVNDNELLYTNTKNTDLKQYKALISKAGTFVKEVKTVNSEEQLVAKGHSDSYAFNLLVIENKKIIKDESAFITTITFGIATAFFVISMFFVMISSQFLTNPIRQLRKIMERTKLENIGEEVSLDTPDDEIEALSITYQNVLERLHKSIIKEKKMSLLQIQAQFDSLQAQVNPHFLYNVLNVIAARGMSTGDEKICEMCGSLAMMLRYSTNNKNRYATIEEELQYLDQYFYLLKSRFEHKIEFSVEVGNNIRKQVIPKIVLQQIVENCINHGFVNSTEQMQIRIQGWEEESHWYIKIHDNGQGFGEETLAEINHKLKITRERLLKEGSNMELEIGGMGLINTYARLLLLYNDELIFKMQNVSDGAEVIIGANLSTDTPK
jgi:two-component system, sensor histidine kinase YesM